MTVDAYLHRLGMAPGDIEAPTLELLTRLQRAHVTTIPFENLSIVGDPHAETTGPGISLSLPHLYDKIVERERGGYCFELNGLFHELLTVLGYEVDRCAARVVSALQTPANHHVNLVQLDQPYVVDVGTGPPMLRTPLPLDGTSCADDAGVSWRVVESERPDAAYRAEVRSPGETEWTPRYVFTPTPRSLSYFAPANEYLQSASESPFTERPIVARSTPYGYDKLTADTLLEHRGTERETHVVSASDWAETLRRWFGIEHVSGERRRDDGPPPA